MLLFSVLLITCITSTLQSCVCKSNGWCNQDGSCSCPAGYYGAICTLYTSTWKVEYETTPTTKDEYEKTFIEELKTTYQYNLDLTTRARLPPGNVFKLSFNRTLTDNDISEIKVILSNIGGSNKVIGLYDYDECENDKFCADSKMCVNTKGSYQCGCDSGNKKCEKRNENTKTVIYMWSGVVVGVILLMIGFIIFYRVRKIGKEKQLQKQHEQKVANRKILSPTVLSEFDGISLRRSPSPSVFGETIDGQSRRFAGSDVASIYSYSSRQYPQSEPDYTRGRSRLSIPVIDGYINNGYGVPRQYAHSVGGGDDKLSVYSNGGQSRTSYGPSNRYSSPFILPSYPSSYTSDLPLVPENSQCNKYET